VRKLTDTRIIDLFCERSENAIVETARQYGAYCRTIAMNILHNTQDTEECVNDTYLNVWNAIPPQRPNSLSAFLGRITRNLALNRYKSSKAQKRGSSLLLSELGDCISAGKSLDEEIDVKMLAEIIDRFLDSLKEEDMLFFVRRYWYGDSVKQIKERYSAGESKVKVSLCRTRRALKLQLEKEGIVT
jgi:RNA polymerase sigma-70 factor (ECF subfamily)